jgi:hypothetical protein
MPAPGDTAAAAPADQVADTSSLQQDADAANLLAAFLAKRDAPDVQSLPKADLMVVCGSSILATA